MAYTSPADFPKSTMADRADAGAFNAYGVLHFAYAIIPILAGADKFFGLMVDWTKYLAPVFTEVTRLEANTFMMMVGAVEVVAGLIVAFKPRIGAYIVAAWFAGIIVNLILHPIRYWDIAARDFGLMLGALALGSLSGWVDAHPRGRTMTTTEDVP
jgi:hypothetical protein